MRYSALTVLYEQAKAALAALERPSFGIPTVMVGSAFAWKDAAGGVWSGIVNHVGGDADAATALLSLRDVKRRERGLDTTLESLRDGLDIAAGREREYAVFFLQVADRAKTSDAHLPQRVSRANEHDIIACDTAYADPRFLILVRA